MILGSFRVIVKPPKEAAVSTKNSEYDSLKEITQK